MAKRTIIELIDDIDDTPAAETVTFGLDQKAYEIDLNESNAQALRAVIEPYIKYARVANRGGRKPRKPKA